MMLKNKTSAIKSNIPGRIFEIIENILFIDGVFGISII